ncbi:hypothetical protein HB948_02725 [Listeria welshimeri]|nr:hypothetical protein [Listeria welshimeri]MBC1632331.1 hypothetical protein [Listeria welshimeri]MBC1638171.1 hypothetical protein [Listeria welshimeri]MBC1671169.1 hypothetical protein [Listeria welshimeri]MBC1681967.1 hypothetical protein [Listeria welshimeri]
MIAEQDNRILSDMAYNVDRKKVDVPLKKGNIIKNKNLSQNYKVIKVEDNSKNGMQAMAVAPIDKHGKVDTTEVIIAYARTNFSDTKDRATDLQTVIQGNKKLDLSPMHPIKESKIADEVKAKYSNSVIVQMLLGILEEMEQIPKLN